MEDNSNHSHSNSSNPYWSLDEDARRRHRHLLLRGRAFASACRLVQDILDQITLNDSPPINDDVAASNSNHGTHHPSSTTPTNAQNTNHSVAQTPSPANKFSRQQHVVLLGSSAVSTASTASVAAGTSPSSHTRQSLISPTISAESTDPLLPDAGLTDESNNSLTSAVTATTLLGGHDQLSLWMKRYHLSERRAESKMGHVALATLCARTLESYQTEIPEEPTTTTVETATATVSSNKTAASHVATARNEKPAAPIDIADDDSLTIMLQQQQHYQMRRASASAAVRSKTALQIDTRPSVAVNHSSKTTPGVSPSTTPSSKPKNRREFAKPQRWLSWRSNNKSPSNALGQQQRSEQHQDSQQSPRAKTPSSNNMRAPTPPSLTHSVSDTIAANTITSPWSIEHDNSNSNFESHNGVSHHDGVTDGSKQATVANTTSTSSTAPQGTVPSVIVDGEQDHHDEIMPQVSPRLKMFGSEYARFLSSTPLGPNTPTNSHHHAHSKSNSSTLLPRRLSNAAGGGNVARAALNQLSTGLKLEDANNAVLTGAITDILITYGDELPPKGYYRISQTGQGDEFKAMLRRTSSSSSANADGTSSARWTTKQQQQQVYINVKKEPSWDRAAQRPCVTALAVIFPDRKEFVPPGFCVVNRYMSGPSNANNNNVKRRLSSGGRTRSSNSVNKAMSRTRSNRNVSNALTESTPAKNVPANLNFGSVAGERVYLCFRRSREGNPITGIIPLQPSNHEPIPEGYTVLERTPRNFVADINAKSGSPVFLAFRQRLANLESLRPLPLVLSVHSADPFGAVGAADNKSRRNSTTSLNPRKRLHAYYCTGGTVVVSDVGRFHIMDRTTHSLLSPSSIANRMSLIELSRRRTTNSLNHDMKQPRPIAMYASSSGTKAPLRTNDLLSSTFRAAHRLSLGGSGGGDDASCQMSIVSGTSLMNASYVSEMGMTGDASSVGDSIASSSLASSADLHFSNRDRVVRDNMMNYSIAEHPTDTPKGSLASSERSDSESNLVILASHSDQRRLSRSAVVQFPPDEDELQLCLEALDFIPTIEPAEDGDETIDTMLFLQQRAALLTPILTACYSRHGGSALIAVEGLTKLLKEVDFFRMDISSDGAASSSRLTLLDITVQTVCDVATTGAQETSFSTCVEFVEAAIRYSKGQLNTRTTGYVLRFYLFVFYFGASIPTSANWPNSVWGHATGDAVAGKDGKMEDDISMLWDPRNGSSQYLPGGAPQAAALALKELITRNIEQLRSAISAAEAATSKPQAQQSLKCFVESILSTLVDKAVHQVDIANHTQLAMHQVHRSGGSELFWHDMMNACGAGLFHADDSLDQGGRDVFVVTFAVLAYLVKVCSGKMRRVSHTSQLMPRDVASKIVCLELLLHFLEQWGDGQSMTEPPLQSVETLLFCIRRLVVPCLLSNSKPGLENPRVFRRLIRIVSVLLCSPVYRKHMKAEIGVLVEHFALRMLQLGPQLLPLNRSESNGKAAGSSLADELSPSLFPQQVELVIAIKRWFSGPPTDLVELYLNFDTNIEGQINGPIQIMPGTQWKVCQQLCALLSSIAEQCGEILGEQVRFSHVPGSSPLPRAASSFGELHDTAGTPGNGLAEMTSLRENATLLRQVTLEAIAQIVKSLAHSAAKACETKFHRLLSVWTSFNPPEMDDIVSLQSIAVDELSTSTFSSIETGNSPRAVEAVVESGEIHATPSVSSDRTGIIDYWQTAILSERRKAGAPRARAPLSKPQPQVGHIIKWQPNSFNKTLQSVHGSAHGNDVTAAAIEPLEVAFSIAHEKSVKRAVDYLVACNVLSPAPRDVASFLRIHKARLNPAILGDYLGEGGNDGAEAEYWNLVRFSYVRAISFAGMTVEQGLRNFLTNGGFRLPGEAQSIDRMMTTFAQCYWEDNAGDIPRCPFHDQDTVYLISFAIIMLNTDLHKTGKTANRKRKKMTKTEFLNNLRGVDHMEEMTRDYLSSIFDSVEANPIVLVDDIEQSGNMRFSSFRGIQHFDVITLLTSMLNSVKTSDALLRGLSVHEHEFFEVKDFSNSFEYGENDALADLTRCFIATTWHQFHGVINAALETAHLDPEGMESCIEVLGYALCVTIALDMKMERVAFLNQLARFKVFKDRRQGQWVSAVGQEAYENEALYTRIEKLCTDESQESEKRRLNAMVLLNRAIRDLHSSFAVDAHVKKDMKRIVTRIREGEYLLNDPSRRFLRDGDLLKKSNRSGRFVEYRFFLFSDMLVYSKFSTVSNDYKIHEELPLHLMKITDWFPPDTNKKMGQQTKRMFQIHHPNKTFLVVAGSSDERKSWVSDIRLAIDEEVRRKAQLEAARVAASSATVGH